MGLDLSIRLHSGLSEQAVVLGSGLEPGEGAYAGAYAESGEGAQGPASAPLKLLHEAATCVPLCVSACVREKGIRRDWISGIWGSSFTRV